ncbi:TPA: type 1 fimbrial protein [Escherichia coli]|nr:type 1 fimbrial protein [Escherichia coli]
MMKSIVACAVAMAMLSFGANAADQGHGKVNFKGSIINAPCGIAPESADQSIDFGQISKAHLNNGGISTKKDVDIKLVNCEFGDPAAGNTVSVTFSGTTVGTADTLGLSDTNAVIKMTGQDGKYVQFDGKTASNTTALMNGDNTLHYQAWVQKGTQAVTEGDFTAVANFTLAYK